MKTIQQVQVKHVLWKVLERFSKAGYQGREGEVPIINLNGVRWLRANKGLGTWGKKKSNN